MGAVDDIQRRYKDDKIGAAKEIGRGLVRGNAEANLRGYQPKIAMNLALLVVGHYSTVDEILDRMVIGEEVVHAHLRGFHDALLKDKGGYQVSSELGFEYESGYREVTDGDRGNAYVAERERQ